MLVGAIGAVVFRARPHAPAAARFGAFTALTALELVAGTASGAWPSRLHAVELFAAALAPAAAVSLTPALTGSGGDRAAIAGWTAGGVALLADGLLHGFERRPALAALRLAVTAFVLLALARAWRRARDRRRRAELGLYLLGIVAAFAPPAVGWSLPRSGGGEPSPWLALPVALCPLAIGYGIVRHRLFDVDLVVRRGVLGAALAGLAAAVYALLAAVVGVLFGAERPPFATALLVAAAALTGGALRARIRRFVDRGLHPARFRYLEAVRRAGADLARMDSPAEVASRLVHTATEVAGLTGAAVLVAHGSRFEVVARRGEGAAKEGSSLDGDEPLARLLAVISSEIHRTDFDDNPRLATLRATCLPRLDELGAELMLALVAGGRSPFGLLALGPRRDGEPFNREDVELFRALAAQAALALGRGREVAGSEPETQAPGGPVAGRRFGHYRLERPLGRGGMGEVWRAVDERLDRPVAIKFLSATRAGEAALLERLRREARALARLDHPNVVTVHALEVQAGHTFLVQERVEGESLRERLDRDGWLDPREAARVAGAVARALGAAFARGLLHRDVKPSNVLLGAGGAVKLADFGLARRLDGETTLGEPGHVVGTVVYLAPELFRGAASDHRSDFYSLGVLLHEAVTGRRPGEDGGAAGAVLAPRSAVPDLADVPGPLRAVVARLLEPDPERRPQEHAALVAELERIERG